MGKSRNLFSVILIVLLGTSLLISCQPTTGASTDSTASVSTTSAQSTTTDGPTIKAIKDKGTLTVATGTYVPFEYRDTKTDEIVGFDIDFAKILADKLGVELKVTDMAFTSIIPSVQKGDYDLAIAAMYDKPERREQVLMSDSYMSTGMILVTKKGNDKGIKSLKDCAGLKVGCKLGGTSEEEARKGLDTYGIKYEVVGYDETVGHAMDLDAGRIDVVVNDLLNQMELNKAYPNQEIVCDPFTQADLSIAVKKGNDDLMDFINKAIKEYKENGTYDELYKKWIE